MYDTIPIQYLDYFLEQGFDGRIVDLRDETSYEYGHIKGAENYPFDDLMDAPSLLSEDVPILFYCSRGSESLLACNRYAGMGYRVINVANGLNLYRGKYLIREKKVDRRSRLN